MHVFSQLTGRQGSLPMRFSRAIPSIAKTGFVAGTLDGLAAIVHYLLVGGKDPARVFMYIASGVFGREAVAANEHLAWWGILFHFFIALCWTALYYVLYPKLKFLSRNVFLSGTGYAMVIWLMMTRIVVPLSNAPQFPLTLSRVLIGVGILVVCVGLPIAILARRHGQQSGQQQRND